MQKKRIFFVFLVMVGLLLIILVFFKQTYTTNAVSSTTEESLSDTSGCFPQYVCGSWTPCTNGLESRNCVDKICGKKDILERRFCKKNCDSNISCGEWGACTYEHKTDDILEGIIKYTGYKTRVCIDTNGCIDQFNEDQDCEESYPLEIRNIVECGKSFLAAIDPKSQRPVAKIDLQSWNSSKLDILFTQGYAVYCPSCYNGYQDGDETGVDCGGSCKPCQKIQQIPITFIVSIILAILAVIFVMLTIKEFNSLSRKNKYVTQIK